MRSGAARESISFTFPTLCGTPDSRAPADYSCPVNGRREHDDRTRQVRHPARGGAALPEPAAEIEALGYGAIWIGGSPPENLALVGSMLAATSRIAVATGIVNMWATPAAEAAASYHRIEAAHPGRFLLGVGIGHPEVTSDYRRPYATMVGYLDALYATVATRLRGHIVAVGAAAVCIR